MTKQIQPPQQSEAQQKVGYSVTDEQINEDLILRCWNGVQDQVRRVIEFNKSQGIIDSDPYIGHTYDGISEPMLVKQKRRWLNTVTHRRSGKPITINSLLESGRISDMEKDLFGTQQYPRIELISMTRVKTEEGSEYLMRSMQAKGLSEVAAVVTLSLNDCDFTRKIPISPGTGKLKDGTEVKILTIGSGEFTYETSPKIWITPFTEANVRATVDKYSPYEEGRGKVGYVFKKEGVANEVSVPDLDSFINADVDETIARSRQAAPTISIDSKGLAAFAKMDSQSRTEHKQYT